MPKPNNESSSNPDPTTVRVFAWKRWLAAVDRPVPGLLESLTYEEARFEPGATAGYHGSLNVVEMGHQDALGCPLFHIGLVDPVIQLLRGQGHDVVFEDRRHTSPGRMRIAREWAAPTDKVGAMIRSLRSKLAGQIEVADDAEALDWCAAIVEAYPNARIWVMVTSYPELRRCWEGLSSRLFREVGIACARAWVPGDGVTVGTPDGVPKTTEGRWEMMLIPLLDRDVSLREATAVPYFDPARVFALVKPRDRDRKAALRLNQIAGEVIRRLGPTPRRVCVVVLPGVTSESRIRNNPLRRKREMIWHNGARNSTVAGISSALASGDRRALTNLGFNGADFNCLPERPSIALLVESPEHGRRLRQLLPDWPLLTLAATGDDVGEDSERVIVTEAWCDRHEVASDVLIRADGGRSPLQVRGFPPPKRKNNSGPAFIVDFADGYDRLDTRDLLRRTGTFKAAGMTVERVVRQGEDR